MPRSENIFEAIESGDARRIIAVVDPMFKKAAREASARAHAEGVEVCDRRARDYADSQAGRQGITTEGRIVSS